LTQHAGKSRPLVTLTHAADDQIKAMLANVCKGLDAVFAAAPQLLKPKNTPPPPRLSWVFPSFIQINKEKGLKRYRAGRRVHLKRRRTGIGSTVR
jgi:hypothetical protein